MIREAKLKGLSTKLIHCGERISIPQEPVETPIYATSAFVIKSMTRMYMYSREGNPTVKALEDKVAAVEGYPLALAFSSGMAAITAVFMGLLRPGSVLVVQSDVFPRTITVAREVLGKMGVKIVESPIDDIINVIEKTRPDMVFVESISNPLLRVADIEALSNECNSIGSILVVDNTIPTLVNLRPSEYKVPITVYSASKYLGGHNDLIGGIVAGIPKYLEILSDLRSNMGSIMDPFTAFLVLRGLKTLELRMEKHNSNSYIIARALKDHKKVSKVHYPGLDNHKDHDIARKVLRGYGGMVSFEINSNNERIYRSFSNLNLIISAGTFGGTESIISHPITMSHRYLDPIKRSELGITEGLLRLSVGLEDPNDILEDLYKFIDESLIS